MTSKDKPRKEILVRKKTNRDRAGNEKDRVANQADRDANQADRVLYQDALRDAGHKDLFMATVVHELRNPLGPIHISLSVLEKQFGPHASFAIVQRQVSKLSRLVDDLLDVARIKSGKFTLDKQPMCLCLLAKDVISYMAADRIQLDLRVKNVVVKADSFRIEQIIVNLLINALRYTENGGNIVVIVDKSDTHAILAVEDTGVGIPLTMQESLFDLFFQEQGEKTGSLGVGLFLCRSIMQSHGGEINVHSGGLGTGSIFTIKLPL